MTVAVETTEFVSGADLIWPRQGEPPDVDVKTYDIQVLLGLYATDAVTDKYSEWANSVQTVRELLDEIPSKSTLPEQSKEFIERFHRVDTAMWTKLDELFSVASAELRK